MEYRTVPQRIVMDFTRLGRNLMTGCFLLHRPMARRPGGARSAARGIWGTPAGRRPAGDPATGVTSRGTPGRAVEGGQPVRVGFRFQTMRLGSRRSRTARRPLPPRQMITKMAATVNLFVDTADIYIQVALAWLLRNPTVTSPIIGASTVEQLQELLSAVGWSLPEEIAQRLDMLTAWDRD
jgi:hypothetical protein